VIARPGRRGPPRALAAPAPPARYAARARFAASAVLLLAGCRPAPPASPARAAPPAPAGAAPAGDSGPTSYDNPILPGFYPDPSLCRVGEDYYLVTSSFEYFPGVPIFHSKDLIHWRQLGHVLTRPSQLSLEGAKSSQGIFAPTIRYHAGTFYVITTNVSTDGTFFVTASDPAGPWSDPIWVKEPVFTMDPSLAFTDDGRAFYTRHGGLEHGGAYQAEIDLKTGQLRGDARLIWTGTGQVWPEGPHLYPIQGRYYLLLAEGGTSTGHRVTIARSASPFGPFEPNPRNPILTHSDRPLEPIQATGHADLVQAADDGWWMVFLGIRRWDGQHHHLGRETFLAPVRWSDDGWPIVNAGAPVSLRMNPDQALPPAHPWPAPTARDDFEGPSLGLDWNFLRSARDDRWSLTARPGHLRLQGSAASLDEIGTPAFVGRRQRHFRASVRARLDFTPRTQADRAGLVLRANEDNHYELALTGGPGERRVQLSTRVDGKTTRIGEQRAGDAPVELGIEAFADHYELLFVDGGEVRQLGRVPTAPLSTESAGGFTGVYIGMFATSTAATPMPPADFDWFEYAPGAEVSVPRRATRQAE
jgi:xylan 1,4-beta-xylosidase